MNPTSLRYVILSLLLLLCEVQSFQLLPRQHSPPGCMTCSSSFKDNNSGRRDRCRYQSYSTNIPNIASKTYRHDQHHHVLFMSDKEWSKVLYENSGEYNDMIKMKGLLKNNKGTENPKLTANANLVAWLEKEGNVYLSEMSTWGEAPHPLAISTETVDEITNENSGRGLLARRDINDGDVLLKIPLSFCLTKKSSRQCFGIDIIKSGMNEYLAIALQLIHEKFVMKEKSKYKPYMDILPDVNEVNPTFTWSESDLNFLQGSPVIAASISLRRKLQREYDMLLTNDLMIKYPQRFDPTQYCYENWIWAFTMLFSRAIRLRNIQSGEILAMVPYADLINHSPYSQSYIDAQETGDWLFKTGEEEVVLYADRGYRRMEQIYISYGPKSNAELLLLYGFAVERNPYNSVDVTVSIKATQAVVNDDGSISSNSVAEDPLAEEKIAFLQSVGREQAVDFPCYADRYPIEMLEYLRLMQMTIDDTAGKSLNEFDYTRAISPGNEAAVLISVIQAIQSQLGKYPNSEEDDASVIKDKKLFRTFTYNQRMAIRHRRNEKRLLKRTIAALEKQLQKQGIVMNSDIDVIDVIAKQPRAEGNTLGVILSSNPDDYNNNEIKKRGATLKTSLEDRLEKMGLPVDLR